jgi:hypothetical protein
MTRLFVAAIVTMSLVIVSPALATDVNLGGGYPLYDTHSESRDNSHLDGGFLIYGSVDKEYNKWLSYGLMYNYTHMDIGIDHEETEIKYSEWFDCKEGRFCPAEGDDYLPIRAEVTTRRWTENDHVGIHVLGPYAKPFYKLGKRVKLFATLGAGGMYVDGPVYGDELGVAGFASAGLSVDLYKGFGITGQYLIVDGLTGNVSDMGYQAPVFSLMYSF